MNLHYIDWEVRLMFVPLLSCFGRVTSLNGEPEPGVIVEALGQEENCLGFQEESKTELDGSYRLRGLLPKCRYRSVRFSNLVISNNSR